MHGVTATGEPGDTHSHGAMSFNPAGQPSVPHGHAATIRWRYAVGARPRPGTAGSDESAVHLALAVGPAAQVLLGVAPVDRTSLEGFIPALERRFRSATVFEREQGAPGQLLSAGWEASPVLV